MVKPLHNVSDAEAAGAVLERMFELAARLGGLMQQGLAEQGLSQARGEVIWELRRQGEMTQRQLSQVLQCTPRNVTGLLDALEAAGLVARGRHPSDRRATLVHLTDEGARLAAWWHEQYQAGAGRLLDGLSAAEITRFSRTLDHVLERLRATAPVPGGEPQ